MEEGKLPEGWERADVDTLGTYINGVAFKPNDWHGKGTPIIRIQNLTDPDAPINRTTRQVDDKYVVERGDILVSWSATLDAFKWHGPTAYVNQHIFKVVPNPEFDADFVFYALKEAIGELVNSSHLHGSTMKHINRKPFLAHPRVLPPVNEQRRIVDRLDTLFAELDQGEAELRKVQTLLARYRQSVLKAAVTGALTADWRARHASAESGEALLARILQARRARWEADQLAKFAVKGKPPKNDKWKQKYKEPAAPDTTGLPDLPEGWVWATVGALIAAGPQNGVYFPQSKYGSGREILRIDDYQIGWIREREGLRQVRADASDISKYELRTGDVVVNRVNSVTHLGKVALVGESHAGALFESNMMRFSVSHDLNAGYVAFYLGSEVGRSRLIANCKHAVNQASINQGDVESTPVPLPSLSEQLVVADRIKALLEAQSETQETITSKLAYSTALRQSILKEAFAGRLVPQDPADEPASALLARIRAARNQGKKKTHNPQGGAQ